MKRHLDHFRNSFDYFLTVGRVEAPVELLLIKKHPQEQSAGATTAGRAALFESNNWLHGGCLLVAMKNGTYLQRC